MSFTYKASWCPGDAKVLIKVFRAAAPKRHFYNLSQADSRSSDSNASLKDPQSFPGRGSLRLTHGSGGVFDLSSTGPCLQKNSAGTEQVFSRKTRTQRMVERPSDHPAVVCGAQDSREWRLRREDLFLFKCGCALGLR